MGSDSSVQYIHTVQHLIEECIVFNMSKEECMEALSKHANINPVVTSTVWKELAKENKEFFEGYMKKIEERASSSAETETTTSKIRQGIQKILMDSPRRKDTNDDDDAQ